MNKKYDSTKELISLLVHRRKELGLSQAELAKLSNLSMNGISKLESNKGEREVKLSTLFKLAEFLGISFYMEFEE